MKDRIQKIIVNEDLTPSRMADLMQVQRSSLSHILAGRNKPSMDFLSKLMQSFPSISGHWLLTGLGDMYLQDGTVNAGAGSNSHQELFFDDDKEQVSDDVSQISSQKTQVLPISSQKEVVNSKKAIKKIIVIYDDYSTEEIFNA